jgi:electron transfer flavoprotein alpha subunit
VLVAGSGCGVVLFPDTTDGKNIGLLVAALLIVTQISAILSV